MSSRVPNFTVFIPVHNGGEYLPICVESILRQSYQEFTLVILENQSIDGTAEWLQNIAQDDSRISVLPSDSLLSIEKNWERILSVPKKEFMTIVGHDDILEANFLEVICDSIKNEPKANLYTTHFNLIDGKGQLIRPCLPMHKYETASEFLAARFTEIRDSFGTGYVVRSEVYESVGGIPNFDDLLYSDDALWLSLIGDKYKVTSPLSCFLYRLHMGSVSGSPSADALFYGLKKYLYFIDALSSGQKSIADVVVKYGPQYIEVRCNEYYRYVIKHLADNEELIATHKDEIERMLEKYVGGETFLEKNDLEIKTPDSHTELNVRSRMWQIITKIKNRLTA